MESLKEIKNDLTTQQISPQDTIIRLERLKSLTDDFDLYMDIALLLLELREELSQKQPNPAQSK
jgi:hypothetical protein